MKIFYVYIAFRPWDGTPCYVGKGKGKRWKCHSYRTHNPWLRRIITRAGGEIPVVVIRSLLSESEAFEIEVAFIKAIGRKASGGPLVNLTDGGEGISGHRHSEQVRAGLSLRMMGKKIRLGFKASDETRALQRSLKLGRRLNPEHIEKLRKAAAPRRGQKRPPEVGAKVSAAQLGKPFSEERKAILRAANRSRDPEVRARISAGVLARNARIMAEQEPAP